MATIELRTNDGQTAITGAFLVLEYLHSGTGAQKIETVSAVVEGRFQADPVVHDAVGAFVLARVRAFNAANELLYDLGLKPGNLDETTVLNTSAKIDLPAQSVPTCISGALLNRQSMAIVAKGRFEEPTISGLMNSGPAGFPSLPIEVRTVMLPRGMRLRGMDVNEGPETNRIVVRSPALVERRVADRPGPAIRKGKYLFPVPGARPATLRSAGNDRGLVVPPIYPPKLVEIAATEEHSWGTLLTLHIRPVRYDAAAESFVHYRDLAFTLDLEGAPDAAWYSPIHWAGGELWNAAANHPTVLAPSGFGTVPALPTAEACPMVIITDDYTWNSRQPVSGSVVPVAFSPGSAVLADASGTPATAGSAVIAAFEALALWKTSRGMRTRVVPIGLIVSWQAAGLFQSVNAGTPRDLQEIIRDFIRYANQQWGTSYVLLGGNGEIVPWRYVTSHGGSDFVFSDPKAVAVNQVEDGLYMAKLTASADSFDSLWNEGGSVVQPSDVCDSTWILCPESTGEAIPYSASGEPPGPCWFFTSAADFASKSSGFSVLSAPEKGLDVCIIVYGGPELQDSFYWVSGNRSAPSDYYYSDTYQTAPEEAGFDANGNGILGQTTYNGQATVDIPIDGMSVTGTVAVGRAPISTVQEAGWFVQKVIQYESLITRDNTVLNPNYLNTVAYIADNFVYPWDLIQLRDDQDLLPANASFKIWTGPDGRIDLLINVAGDESVSGSFLDVRLASDLAAMLVSAQPGYTLNFIRHDGTVQECAYSFGNIPTDAAGNLAPAPFVWALCDPFYQPLTPAPGVTGQFDCIRLFNVTNDVDCLFWNIPNADYGSIWQENLRQNMPHYFPDFTSEVRVYRDAEDYPDANVYPLTADHLAVLQTMQLHFVSLSSHGNVNNMFNGMLATSGTGTVQIIDPALGAIDVAEVNTNFIAFALACLTCAPDGAGPSLGETWVKGQTGALAYVGWTRSCWVAATTAAYEEGFWCATSYFGRLGPAVAAHVNQAGFQQFESLIPIVLYGDPEMPVWTGTPRHYTVNWDTYNEGVTTGPMLLVVTVMEGETPLAGHTVTVLRGWHGSLKDPDQLVITTTDLAGRARFLLLQNETTTVGIGVMPPVFPRQNFIPLQMVLQPDQLVPVN